MDLAWICPACGTPTKERTHCKRPDTRVRPTAEERGYDSAYRKRRAELRKLRRPCVICSEPIDYTLKWPHPGSYTAQHLTRDKSGAIDAAHWACNRAAGQPAR